MGASFWLCSVIIEQLGTAGKKLESGVHATNVQTSETQGSYQPLDARPPNKTASLCRFWARRAPQQGALGTGYFSASTTYRRITLTALSRWGARSAQAFDL
jgi:hypothetical protein